MSLRSRLRAPLIAAVSTALVGGLLAFAPAPTQAAPSASAATSGTTAKPDKPHSARTKAAMLARERRKAKADGLTQSRAVFARSSYLCTGYRGCTQAGMDAEGYAAVNDKMYWRMYAGHNCTNYVAYRMVKSGMPNERPWSGGGNATYWGTSVPSLTDRVPAVGAVAWWKANTGPAGSAGHVAYVEKVVSDDQIIISQDSWGGDFSWAVVTRSSGNWPSGFIHFNDRKLINQAVPTVSGIAKVGATLNATSGTWSPQDATVSYQWYANGTAIPKATKPRLALGGARLGQVIRVRTTATKLGYPTKVATSTRTAAVLPGVLSSTAAPLLSGVVKVDKTLSLDPGSWNVTPDSTTVQWYADGQPIAGAVGGTLRLTPELAGRVITAQVTAVRAYYDPVTVTTSATVPVALGTITSTETPTVSGAPTPGQTLTVAPGAYRPGDATVTVQWLRDGQPVLNATGPTYQVTPVDLGTRISSIVTVSRAGYETTNLTSPMTVRVRVAPRIRIERVRHRHAVSLRITVSAPYVAETEGKVVVRVRGGFRQVLDLRHGVARVRVSGLPTGKRMLTVAYRGSRSVEKVAKTGWIRNR